MSDLDQVDIKSDRLADTMRYNNTKAETISSRMKRRVRRGKHSNNSIQVPLTFKISVERHHVHGMQSISSLVSFSGPADYGSLHSNQSSNRLHE